MIEICRISMATVLAIFALLGCICGPAAAAVNIAGQVQAGAGAVANSTVTLWAAGSGDPRQLAQAQSGSDGNFVLGSQETLGNDAILYFVAKGGVAAINKGNGNNPAIALLTVLGNTPPAKVVINEMTTIASVWTHNQFINGTAIKGLPFALRIAAGNVSNFVDLTTGGYGTTIADGMNSTQTPTLANFATLANVLSGCATLITADACDKLFIAATPPTGSAPTDTLTAAETIARFPSQQPEKVFALLEGFYPLPQGKLLRPTPFLPYLSFAPSAWVLPLKFTGGGLNGGGKLMFDSQGNAWVVDNFGVGAQNQDIFWRGYLSKFAPDGKPLSPPVTGFTGGGVLGPGFGLAIDAHDNPWVTSFGGNTTISNFDNSGRPLSPPEGYNFGGKISKMQGIIATPSGDIWAIDTMNSQVVHFPKGDASKGELLCQNPSGDPFRNPCKLLIPFALAIDQQDNIWVTNFLADHVTRFPAGNPTKFDTFKTGFSSSGLAVDSLGNVWITNKLGSSEHGRLKMLEMALAGKVNYDGDRDASSRITSLLVPAMASRSPDGRAAA